MDLRKALECCVGTSEATIKRHFEEEKPRMCDRRGRGTTRHIRTMASKKNRKGNKQRLAGDMATGGI